MTNDEVKAIIHGKIIPPAGNKICGSIYGERYLGDGTKTLPNGMSINWESYNGRVDYVLYPNGLPVGFVWNKTGIRQYIQGPKWTLEYKDPDYETRFYENESTFIIPEFLEKEIQECGIPYKKVKACFGHKMRLHILAKDL